MDVRQSCVSRFSVFFERDVDMDFLYAGSSAWLAGKEEILSLLVMKIRRSSLLVMKYRRREGAYRLVYNARCKSSLPVSKQAFCTSSTWHPVSCQLYVVSGTAE